MGSASPSPISEMKRGDFHPQESVAAGVRLPAAKQDSGYASLAVSSHPLIRLLSAILTLILFFSGSPALFAASARDVMGAGNGGGGGKGGAANLQNAGAASASLTATRAREVMKHTDAQVAAMKTLQSSARAIMTPSSFNGLDPNGLVPSATVKWNGASISSSGTANTVNIQQTKQNAYLYWDKFNVGSQTTLNFDQSAGGADVGTWIAFNKVMGNVSPSHIYGSITAQGQVYILNQNGIIFHNGSQVNTHALVASTLPINENLAGDALNNVTGRGIANNPDYQFLFTALPIALGKNGPTKAFTPVVNGPIGDVTVEQGATITAPVNSSHTGGFVALVGPHVNNAGTISTPNGQTVLAAGLQVGLTPHPSADPSLRGMDVYVGQVSDPTVKTVTTAPGTAENNGFLSISEANVTMAGSTVRQNGVIDSSTSVTLNGRIDLLANYNALVNANYKSDGTAGSAVLYQKTGLVDIGAGSVMRILPEWNSTETVPGSALALNSILSIVGQDVHMNSGAIIQAPGATGTAGAVSETGSKLPNGVTFDAGSWVVNGINNQFAYTLGKITFDPSAQIDVSGSTGINVDSSKNFLTVQLRGYELANSPLQRTGAIRGQSITIDTRITGSYNGQYWLGTPLGDASGFAGLIQRTVGELTTKGGSIALSAGDTVEMQGGSKINVSGGWVKYSGGNFGSSKVMYQGHVMDISQAIPDRLYSSVITSAATVEKSSKWGVTKTYKSVLDPTAKHYEAAYTQGADGGSIAIQAPSVILNGTLEGQTVAGPRQVRSSPSLSTMPANSSLSVNLSGNGVVNQVPVLISPYAPFVTFAANGSSSQSSLVLAPDLVSAHGFGNLNVLNHDGSITVPANTTLDAGINGSVTLEAANINVDGSIKAPGGSVSLTADLAPYSVINAAALVLTPTQPIVDVVVDKTTGQTYGQYGASAGGMTQVVNADGSVSSLASGRLTHLQAGIVRVGSGAQIITAGTLINDLPNSSKLYQPIALSGGQISVSGYQTLLEKGGVLDVSGGALVSPGQSTVYGEAGSLSLSGGQDTQLKDIHGGFLNLGSTLSGYAGAGHTAGTLSISAPAIRIGAPSSVTGVVNLTSDFFNQGGFGNFNLTGLGREIAEQSVAAAGDGSTAITKYTPGIEITPGTSIHPVVDSLLAVPSRGGLTLSTYTPPALLRASPNISMTAAGLSDANLTAGSQRLVRGDLIMGEGASVILDPQINKNGITATANAGSLAFSGNTVLVKGSVTVPGGSISISGGGSFVSNDTAPTKPLITVDITSSANLSTAGQALYTQDPLKQRNAYGVVLPGGSITISGNIYAESGAVLDASGANGLYDLLPSQLGAVTPNPTSSTSLRASASPSLTSYRVDSAGGSIILGGSEMLYSEAKLSAASGGATAPGGSLNISSGRSYDLPTSTIKEPTDLNLAVQQRGSVTTGASIVRTDGSVIGQALPYAGGIAEGGGHVVIDNFNSGGFDNITLGGNVIFNGSVSLSVPGKLRVATKGVLSADSSVDLTASYVALGTPFALPFAPGSSGFLTAFGNSTDPSYLPPTFGPGRLNVTARLIDLGNLSMQNIGSAKLTADDGAIRGDGTVDIAGDIVLRAAQIYPSTGAVFTLSAYNHNAKTGQAVASGGVGGSIEVQRSGSLNLPISAAGSLSLYASSITQGGVLVAPFGTINLGSDGGVSAPLDPVSGNTVPTATRLKLSSGSVTSVSAINPLTGLSITVPYGLSTDGTSWVDPSGTVITTTGLPNKSVNISAQNLAMESGSTIDLRGGGSVVASEWISGLGGKINLLGTPTGSWSSTPTYAAGDLVTYKGTTWSARQANSGSAPSIGLNWSKVPQSWAIVPGYQPLYAPTGYSDGSIGVGSQIKISSSGAGLPAGTYTLLPASYAATQPGAYLITQATTTRALKSSVSQPDGTVIVMGTQVNGLDSSYSAPKTVSQFQLSSPAVAAKQAQYALLDAGTFFPSAATSLQPADAAKLVFKASSSMALNGNVYGQGAAGGRSASIDIGFTGGISITPDGTGGTPGDAVLGAALLNSWGYGSLLVGGLRSTPLNGLTPVTVTSDHVTVSPGTTLSGNDIILADNDAVRIGNGASIVTSQSSLVPDQNLSFSGHGVMLRVSSDRGASASRTIGGDGTAVTGLKLDPGVNLSGASLVLDSSGAASIAPSVVLNGKTISIAAGKLALNFDGSTESGAVLNLGGNVLQNLSSALALNLTSYSSIDFHGSGVLGSSAMESLRLRAGEILGDNFSQDTLLASSIQLDNANASTDPSGGNPVATGGSLNLSGSLLNLGGGALSIGGFQNVSGAFTGGVQGTGTAKGTLSVAGNLTISTPILTGANSANTTINAGGAITIGSSGKRLLTPGLGAAMTLKGSTVSVAAPIVLPSGSVSLEATAGSLAISSLIDVSGTVRTYYDVTKYTDGGTISLKSDLANILLSSGSVLSVGAQTLAGSAGTVSISAPNLLGGTATIGGAFNGLAPNGTAGSIVMDLGSYNGGDLSALEGKLSAGGFTQSQNIRIRSGDVTVANATARSYSLSADSGSITVLGNINASGSTGGSIALQAKGSIHLNSTSLLNAHGDSYDAAGKGGSVFLSAGTENAGIINAASTLDLQNGSAIDLGVTAPATSIQNFGGVLHLRTPRAALAAINLASTINGASSIEVEGYKLYQVAGAISTAQRTTIANDATTFFGASGANSVAANAIINSLNLNLSAPNQAILNLAPGVEIINQSGGLTLAQQLSGSGVNNNIGDWNLSTLRTGADKSPGFLTLRALGNITLNASLSDGFASSAYNANLLSQNLLLPANFQSWSYQISAGSDLTAANPNAVLSGAAGDISLGVVYASGGQNKAPSTGANASTALSIAGSGYNYYQVIRTGTGDISIAAAGSLNLWNQFASIYTAGVNVTDPTLGGTFDIPRPTFNNQNSSLNTVLGAAQQTTAYTPQFSYSGGNITVSVGQNINQLTKDINHNIIADSVSELPSNWLYRRGALDPVTGTFLQTTFPATEVASTAWWIDFSNFFDDFGALGGGNIRLTAGGNISNINASIPTNFRMPGKNSSGNPIQAGSVPGVELGGGNLAVRSGNNLDAGVYYVERGNGVLNAGGSIITNPTRDPNHSPALDPTLLNRDSALTYLPTTLFLGKGSFNVQASGNVLLGPVGNAFLLPQGVNNSYWYKDYFSTYATTDSLNVTSLGGNISLREEAVTSLNNTAQPLLSLWMQGFVNPASSSPANMSFYQPWLRLAEPTIDTSLATILSIQPPSLNATSFNGNISFQGNYTTSPSPVGNLSLVASGGVYGLTDAGTYGTAAQHIWIASQVILSDADPSSIPGISNPTSQRSLTPSTLTSQAAIINFNGNTLKSPNQPLPTGIAALFAESGSYTGTYGSLLTKLQLHGNSLLHQNDTVPVQIYAQGGGISGLTLFSPKRTLISAGGDITDIAFYIQNNLSKDISVVSANANIIAYDSTSVLQKLAQAALSGTLQNGDIQISGPGILEVLAGGNIDLGNGPNNSDGTGVGITSIGNNRNPSLPFGGADIVVGAGVKLPNGLASSGGLALQNFANTVIKGSDGATYLSELADTLTYSGDPLVGKISATSFDAGSTVLSDEEKARLELALFYIVLRDTGRNYNKVGSSGYHSYQAGEQAIQTLFGSLPATGGITTWSRDIRTKTGGNISLFAPGGGLSLSSISALPTLTPPGIVTEHGGGINIYTQKSVSLGIGRIFTLRGGDIMIWSDKGDIAAGSSAKTVATAPPTRVLIDPQSGNLQTDLAGLATGGGIGVLATVADVPPGNVDLIAPSGVIDAGDAGIRATGNLNLAATKILNADNIAAGGTTAGAPPAPPPPPAPNVSGAAAASTAGAASTTAAANTAKSNAADTTEPAPSVISVEVLGYGGGDALEGNTSTAPAASSSETTPPQASL